MWRFWPWAYRAGFKVVDTAVQKPMVARVTTERLDLPYVRAATVDTQQILFRAPMPLFAFRIKTPFPILGTAMLEGEALHIIGRIPLGTTGFFAAWLIGWTVGGVATTIAKPALGISFTALGWLFAGVTVAFSLPLELRRFRRAQDALLSQIAGTAA